MINIKTFGAAGDGITDDAAVINAALKEGGEIFIPDGEYMLGDTLKIHSHTHITASDKARLFRKEHTQTGRKDYLLTNADIENGNTDISISGGIWDGNCRVEDRGEDLFDPCATSGTLINFRNVKSVSLSGMTLKNALCYYTRFCEAENVTIENIRFASETIVRNQDGIHLAGFCKNFSIKNLYGEYGSPNDDFIALNADDAMERQECFDVVNGPIENVIVENLHSDFCHCFVRILSVVSSIKNIKVTNITGKFKRTVLNLDAARNCRVQLFDEKDYPNGVGDIENVIVDGLAVSHDDEDEPFIALETNCKNFTVRNFKNTGDECGAFTVIKNTAAYKYTLEKGGEIEEKKNAAAQKTVIRAESVDRFSFEAR